MAARPERFPGLLDGLIEPFFTLAGEALAEGRDPALVWPGVVGVVRLDAREPRRTRADLDAEWDLAEEVLQAACGALAAGDAAREWVSRAIVIARTGARSLTRAGPRGILTVRLHGATGVRPRRRARGPGPR
jgi:hypothetical protein